MNQICTGTVKVLGEKEELTKHIEVVGLGFVHKTTKFLVVNPETKKVCKPYQVPFGCCWFELTYFEQIGEFWLSNSSVAKGYWNKPDLTKETFQAYTDVWRGTLLENW